MVVDVVHQRRELRDRVVELDVGELLLLHALDLHAQRQHPLHVAVVVRDVEPRLRHVVLDEVPRLDHQVPRHAPAQVLARLPPLGRLPLLRVRHHGPGLVARQRLHPESPLVPRLRDPLRLPAQAPEGPPHRALVDQHTAGTFEELAHLFNISIRTVRKVQAEALFVVRGDFERTAGAGPLFFGQPDFAAVVVELLHRAGFLIRDGMGGHDGFDVVACGQVGFDAGAEGGGERARHNCCW